MTDIAQPDLKPGLIIEDSVVVYTAKTSDNLSKSNIYFETSVAKPISCLDSNTLFCKSKQTFPSDSDDDLTPELVYDSDSDGDEQETRKPLFTVKTSKAYTKRRSKEMQCGAAPSTNVASKQSLLADFYPYL